MSWAAFHSGSEKSATEAEQAFRSGDLSRATDLYRQAADLEEKALAAIDPAKTRTRGITAVSAVSLWYKAAAYDHAEQLAHAMLADTTIPAFSRSDLRNLVQAIWTESSKKAANVTFLPGQVFVSVKGGDIITGGAPLDLVVQKVQTIQSMFFRTIEFIRDMPLRTRGLPLPEIQESCRPWLFQAAPGSYQFSVAIQEPKQRDFFREDVRPDLVASHFLEILKATTSEDEASLAAIVPKPEYRAAFLRLSRNLAPSGKSYESIEFKTATRDMSVALTQDARTTINKAIKNGRPAEQPDESMIEEHYTGVLRAVDLEKDYLDVFVGTNSMRIEGLGDAMDDVIGPMVNKKVRVSTARAHKGRLLFRDIELDE